MSNNLVNFSSKNSANLPSTETLLQGARNIVQEAPSDTSTLLRMLDTDMWVYGLDNTEVQEGSEWAVNPYSLEHGYVVWSKSRIIGEVMVPSAQPLPAKSNLPDIPEDAERGAEWMPQLSMRLQCISGDDAGQDVLYKSSSRGGRKAISGFCVELARHLTDGGQDTPVAAVTLDTSSYFSKTWNKDIVEPVFTIERWISMNGPVDEDDTAQAQKPAEQEPAKSKRRTPSVEAKVADEKVEAKVTPRGRRRRPAAAQGEQRP